RMQRRKHALEVAPAADGVAVQPCNPRLRKDAVQQLFQLLRAAAEELHILAHAFGTLVRNTARVAAVVAQQPPVALMMRQRDGAIAALNNVTASAAQHER